MRKKTVSSVETEPQSTGQLIEVRDRTVADVMLGQVAVQNQMPTRQIDDELLPTERRIIAKAALLILSCRLVIEETGIAKEIVISTSLIEAVGMTL